jgi:hypothetical protein
MKNIKNEIIDERMRWYVWGCEVFLMIETEIKKYLFRCISKFIRAINQCFDEIKYMKTYCSFSII